MAFENLNEIDPEMLPIFKNLVSMNHNLSKLQGYSFDILANFQNQLHDIENKADLMNLNIDGGRAMVSNVLDKNYTLVEDMMSKLEIQPPLLEIYEELESIQRQLLSILSSPIRFSYNVDGEIRKYQNRLIEIESSSKDGVYGGSLHIMIPKGQAAISNLLNQCHSSINRLLFPDPVDFSLLEWYTKLLLTRERLRELKRLSRRGHSPANEISSIQEFLDAIEENKENGIYYGIGSHNRKQVPTGQGTFIGVVEECRRKLEKLRCFDPAGGFN